MDGANAELAQLVRQSGCAEAVQLLGERSDVRDIARALDLHVLASIGSEGFPNVVAETMLSGTPNVVTDVGDSALIVGDTGWVVSPADAGALADAVEAAYKQRAAAPEEWARRRDSARKRIVENFSLERMIRAYEGVWQKVAGTAVQELQ
jgi:glycosyltransferase involved in cell wall biosynthesis